MTAILQAAPIDVTNWKLDDLYFNYPEGARSKNAIFPPDGLQLDFIKPGRRYLYKRSDKKYPDQFWGEVIAYQIGSLLGVTVPPAYAAFNDETQTCGALIEWFYEDGSAIFVAGGNFMQMIQPDFDRKKGNQHNFRYIETIGRLHDTEFNTSELWYLYWSKAVLFDALIGNTDRHQDNWGYLYVGLNDEIFKSDLSPLFDNGTSLGCERFPHLVKHWSDHKFDQYISKGTHHMRLLKDDRHRLGHFDMIKFLVENYPDVRPVLTEMLRAFSIEALAEKLERLMQLQLKVPLTRERAALILRLLSLRKQKIELITS